MHAWNQTQVCQSTGSTAVPRGRQTPTQRTRMRVTSWAGRALGRVRLLCSEDTRQVPAVPSAIRVTGHSANTALFTEQDCAEMSSLRIMQRPHLRDVRGRWAKKRERRRACTLMCRLGGRAGGGGCQPRGAGFQVLLSPILAGPSELPWEEGGMASRPPVEMTHSHQAPGPQGTQSPRLNKPGCPMPSSEQPAEGTQA